MQPESGDKRKTDGRLCYISICNLCTQVGVDEGQRDVNEPRKRNKKRKETKNNTAPNAR